MSQRASKRTRTENAEEHTFSYTDAPEILMIKYNLYFEKLFDFEKAINSLQVERSKQEFSQEFGLFYSAEIIGLLTSHLPDAIFRNDRPVVPQENFQAAVLTIFPNISDSNVKLECRKIWEIIYGINKSEAKVFDDTPDFVVDENNVLVIKKSCSEFYPFQHIFIRECYVKLYPKVVETAKNTVVALIGDPGIGKSTFLRYVFANIVGNGNGNGPRQKVFWIMESGFWRYSDGINRYSGNDNSDLWIDPEVLLLIDGAFKNEHLHRTRNVILFCSPQHQNYEKMIKASSGAIFVMPPWDLNEVNRFIDIEIEALMDSDENRNENTYSDSTTSTSTALVQKQNILCKVMKVFYDRLCRQTRSEEFQRPPSPNIEIVDGSFLNYNEFEGVNNFPQVQFLKNEVLNRFSLVGGKISKTTLKNASLL